MGIPNLEKLKKYTTIDVIGYSAEKLQENLFTENDGEIIKELIFEKKLKIANTDKDINKYIANFKV